MTQVTLEKTRDYLILKIPLKSVKNGRTEISSSDQEIIDEAIAEGLHDIENGQVFGPFKNVKEFKAALKKQK